MAKKDPDHAYSINSLNMWFAISSILLFIFFMWTMWQDFGRPWKRFQAEFRRLDLAKTKAAIDEETQNLEANPEYQKVIQEMASAEEQRQQQRGEHAKAVEEQKAFEGVWYNADQKYRFKKAEFEAYRYDYEETVANHPEKAEEAKKELDEIAAEMDELSSKLDEVNGKKAEISGRVDAFLEKIKELEREQAKLSTKKDRLERKEKNISPNFANRFRNLPIFDFIDPSIKIQQAVVNNLFEDLNFIQVPRVDRCMTCHPAIASEGYEAGAEIPDYGTIQQPFVSHPKLDLFVGSNSKHPMEKFGCTGCHLGRGRSTDFIGAVHIPENEEQKKAWEEKYDWHKLHHWLAPMYRSDMVEASCMKCHQGVALIPEGDKINKARMLFIESGCHGCHSTSGFENLPKVGPDLRRISSKVSKDWAFKWIKNPKSFRPTTRMPRYFGNTNNSAPEDVARTDVEIKAMVEFLFSRSQKLNYGSVEAVGDPVNGKKLVHEIGCTGCHLTEGETYSKVDSRRRFGPALIGFASKTNRNWLYNWLKEPRHYAPLTRMPNMRLSDQEIQDIVEYFMTLRKPEWEAQQVPALQDTYLKDEILHYLKRTYGLKAEEQYDGMSEQDRWVFLGEKTVQRYGCTGCHLIEGFENAKGIGTSLSEEGSKLLTKFDFGFVEIEHSAPAWISQKLQNPRIYDKDRVKRWDEKLMMPNFDFSEEEIQSLTMLIMGKTKELIPQEAQDTLTAREQIIEKGKWLILQRNCVACHNIDGWGGEIAEIITEQGMAPPALIHEGEKVHSDWLFQFLKSPGRIRPWLNVRMPNFRFSDEEANTLVQYFMAAGEVGPFATPSDLDQHVADGESLFKTYQCGTCHVVGDQVPEGRTAADLAPDLTMARTRLRADWIVKWLDDPQALLPGTRMPDFFPEAALPNILEGNSEAQRKAIRNYLYSIGTGNKASIGPLIPMLTAEEVTASPAASSP